MRLVWRDARLGVESAGVNPGEDNGGPCCGRGSDVGRGA